MWTVRAQVMQTRPIKSHPVGHHLAWWALSGDQPVGLVEAVVVRNAKIRGVQPLELLDGTVRLLAAVVPSTD